MQKYDLEQSLKGISLTIAQLDYSVVALDPIEDPRLVKNIKSAGHYLFLIKLCLLDRLAHYQDFFPVESCVDQRPESKVFV